MFAPHANGIVVACEEDGMVPTPLFVGHVVVRKSNHLHRMAPSLIRGAVRTQIRGFPKATPLPLHCPRSTRDPGTAWRSAHVNNQKQLSAAQGQVNVIKCLNVVRRRSALHCLASAAARLEAASVGCRMDGDSPPSACASCVRGNERANDATRRRNTGNWERSYPKRRTIMFGKDQWFGTNTAGCKISYYAYT